MRSPPIPTFRTSGAAHGPDLRQRFADRLFADVVRSLYRYEINAVIGHAAAALLVAWFTSGELSRPQLTGLLVAVLGGATLRLVLALRFRRQTGPPQNFDLTLHNAVVMTCGAAWSLNFICFFDELSPARRAFFMMVLAGLTAGSLVTLSARPRSFALFSSTLLLPPVIALLVAHGPLDADLAVMALLFFGFCVTGARKSSGVQTEMLLKRYQNQEIMGDLARTKHELELAYERSEAANQAKQRFLANVSHEVRTPLNGVIGITEMLIESGLRPEQAEQAEIVRRCGSNLLLLVNDLLDLSKIESGRMTIESVRFEPESLLRDVVTLHAANAAQRRIGLTLAVEAGLPAQITGDPTRLRQVLNNLIGNAVKFTDEGEIRVRAALGVRAGAARLQVEVADDGVGIQPDRLEAIFEAFVQADDSTTRTHGGTGLGLAITRQILELMGGSIHVESTPGVGSTFRFEIPVRPEDLGLAPQQQRPGARAAQAPPTADPGSRPAADRPRLLLAEDQDVNALVLKKALARLGFEVTRARDGREALELFDPAVHAAVILDLQMPRLDGLGTARALRQRPDAASVPILALSAHCDPAVATECLAAGMNDALQKPCSLIALRTALAAYPGLLPTPPSGAGAALQPSMPTGR